MRLSVWEWGGNTQWRKGKDRVIYVCTHTRGNSGFNRARGKTCLTDPWKSPKDVSWVINFYEYVKVILSLPRRRSRERQLPSGGTPCAKTSIKMVYWSQSCSHISLYPCKKSVHLETRWLSDIHFRLQQVLLIKTWTFRQAADSRKSVLGSSKSLSWEM